MVAFAESTLGCAMRPPVGGGGWGCGLFLLAQDVGEGDGRGEFAGRVVAYGETQQASPRGHVVGDGIGLAADWAGVVGGDLRGLYGLHRAFLLIDVTFFWLSIVGSL